MSRQRNRTSQMGHSRTWAQCLDDRLTWLMSIRWVPTRVWQIMVVLIQHADPDGFAQVGAKVVQKSTNLHEPDVLAAFAEAVDMGLLVLDSTSAGSPRWLILEAGEPSKSLPALKEYLLAEVRRLPDLTNQELLVLEAMIDMGFCHSDRLLRVSVPIMQVRLPRIQGHSLINATSRLRQKGYLIQEERGYRVKPAVYRLVLPVVRDGSQAPVPFPAN